jgi:ATP-dependent RNA helicase DeaD
MSSHTTIDTPSFYSLGLPITIIETLKQLEYQTPTPIQVKAIPILLAGDDIIGQAQTGTGKTAAFALPVLSKINITHYYPQILVLVPTRELAIQVASAFTDYSAGLGAIRVLPIYGGQAYGRQLAALKQGVHVVIGTPGRIMDHLERKTLDLSKITTLILDEADEMLKMGFIDDVETIIKQAPKKRQIALFSATMPAAIRAIADRHLHKPKNVAIKAVSQKIHSIKQCYWEVKGLNKIDALSRILEVEKIDAVLVFMKTKKATEELAEQLSQRKFAVVALNGDIVQQQRERIIKLLKDNKVNIVIATDVAARGLDIDRISHVINYDLPNNIDSYTHRIGRTGRAGRFGIAISFVSPREKYLIRNIERATKYNIDLIELPSVQEVNNKRIVKFKQRITDTLAKEDIGIFESLILQYQNEHKVPAIAIAASLAKLLNMENEFLLVPNKSKVANNDNTNSYPKKTAASLKKRRIVRSRRSTI